MTGNQTEHIVATEDEIAEGEHVVVEVEGTEIGVFNVDEEYHAYTNWCPHYGAPVCEGPLYGTTDAEFDREELDLEFEYVRQGQILRCPWHAWEFDVTTGKTLHADEARLIEHEVHIENGNIIITL